MSCPWWAFVKSSQSQVSMQNMSLAIISPRHKRNRTLSRRYYQMYQVHYSAQTVQLFHIYLQPQSGALLRHSSTSSFWGALAHSYFLESSWETVIETTTTTTRTTIKKHPTKPLSAAGSKILFLVNVSKSVNACLSVCLCERRFGYAFIRLSEVTQVKASHQTNNRERRRSSRLNFHLCDNSTTILSSPLLSFSSSSIIHGTHPPSSVATAGTQM